jgi:membrane protein YdbS with pleckstrin-like domain
MSDARPDPAQADLAWSGYHPRAAVPVLVLASAGALFVSTGRHYLDDFSALAARVSALALFALPWAACACACAAYLYKCVTYTYRLTDRAVHADFGPLFRPVPPLELRDVSAVRARAGPLGRLLGVGRVEVRGAGRVLRLPGVRDPEALANRIRAAAHS